MHLTRSKAIDMQQLESRWTWFIWIMEIIVYFKETPFIEGIFDTSSDLEFISIIPMEIPKNLKNIV